MLEDSLQGYLDSDDFDLIGSALTLFPDLAFVIVGAKLVRTSLEYPISDVAALRPIFGDNGVLKLGAFSVSFEQAERFIPADFFPMESETDFLTRMLIALQIGEKSHQTEERAAVEFDNGFTLLPSPSLIG